MIQRGTTHVEAVFTHVGPDVRIGALRVPRSAGPHPYGTMPVPIAEIGQGSGPTVLLVAGNHGDEYEGRVILQQLIQRIDPSRLSGRLVILPALNLHAVRAGTRISPLDGGDMNRSFLGNPEGGPTAAIADYVEHEILPGCDAAIDLHAGGSVTEYVPCTFVYAGGPLWVEKHRMVEAFALPGAIHVAGGKHSLSAAAERQGVPLIAAELAGGGSLSRSTLEIGWNGTLRVLEHRGVLDPGEFDLPPRGPIRHLVMDRPEHYLMAEHAGVFEPAADLGDTVSAGAVAGWIHPAEPYAGDARELLFATDGVVVCRRVPAETAAGDYLLHLARPVDLETLASRQAMDS